MAIILELSFALYSLPQISKYAIENVSQKRYIHITYKMFNEIKKIVLCDNL